MGLLGKIKDRFFGRRGEERAAAERLMAQAVQEAQENDLQIPVTRAYVRAHRRWMRLKGPGYTRSMRKGRTQRVRDEA